MKPRFPRILPWSVSAAVALLAVVSARPESSNKDKKKPGPNAVFGRIQIVDAFPDVRVKVVTAFPDLRVKRVDAFPDKPGRWQFVDSFPDFRVQFVDSFPDFTVQFENGPPPRKK